MSESAAFLGARRGARIQIGIPGFEVYLDTTADNAGNLMSAVAKDRPLLARIEDVRTNGHDAARDGDWRLDTDQAPPVGGFNTQIQLNNSAGAKALRTKGKATSATCVLVQNGANMLPRYAEALGAAHAESWTRHAQLILSIEARNASPMTTWACNICGGSTSVLTTAPKPQCLKNNKKCGLAAT